MTGTFHKDGYGIQINEIQRFTAGSRSQTTQLYRLSYTLV